VFPIPGSLASHAAFNPVNAAEELAYCPLTASPLVQQA